MLFLPSESSLFSSPNRLTITSQLSLKGLFQHSLRCNPELTLLYQSQTTPDFYCRVSLTVAVQIMNLQYGFLFFLLFWNSECLGSRRGWLSQIVDLVSNSYNLFLSGKITPFTFFFFNAKDSGKPESGTESGKHKREGLGGTWPHASRDLYGFRAGGLDHNINRINTEHSSSLPHTYLFFSFSDWMLPHYLLSDVNSKLSCCVSEMYFFLTLLSVFQVVRIHAALPYSQQWIYIGLVVYHGLCRQCTGLQSCIRR